MGHKIRDTSQLDQIKKAVDKIDENDKNGKSAYPHNKQKVTSIGHKWEMNEPRVMSMLTSDMDWTGIHQNVCQR